MPRGPWGKSRGQAIPWERGALGATSGGAWRGACLGSPAPGPAEGKRPGAQLSPSSSARSAPRASAGSADYLSAELRAGPCCPPPRCARCLALAAPRLHSAPRVRPVVMAGLVVSGTQVSPPGRTPPSRWAVGVGRECWGKGPPRGWKGPLAPPQAGCVSSWRLFQEPRPALVW